jgi:putative PIN family toxin of toxin-antitoxin system
MLAVLDTCVLISALRSRQGASFQILRAVRNGSIQIAISVALAVEYEGVALRPGMVPAFSENEIATVIDVLCHLAKQQRIFYAWRPFLADADDDLVLELALAASAPFIITHNIKDFHGSESMGIRAITPSEALNLI